MPTIALDIADPETPVGARGVGEPPVGAGYGAVLNAIADAVGVDVFRRAPVTADMRARCRSRTGGACTNRCVRTCRSGLRCRYPRCQVSGVRYQIVVPLDRRNDRDSSGAWIP